MDGSFCCAALVWGAFWSIVGAKVGESKNQSASGAVWCFLFGPFGLLVLLLLPDARDPDREDAISAVRIEEEERRMRDRIDREERIRAEVRAKIDRERGE